MLTIYGIKNCDTMKKAFAWLDKHKVVYVFHDYKKESIQASVLVEWLKNYEPQKLINTKGLTWKKLSEKEQKSIGTSSGAAELMVRYTSAIKRPIVVKDGKILLLGFAEEEWKEKLH